MNVLGISGTIIGSKIPVLVERILAEMKNADPSITTELLNLKEYKVEFCDGRSPDLYTGDTRTVIDKVCAADCYIIGTPVFQASMTGVLKNLFDLIPVGAFRHKVIGFVANGGTYQHYLVIENQLKPIAGYFRAYVAPSYVYAHNEHFDKTNNITDPDLNERITRLAEEILHMQKSLSLQYTSCCGALARARARTYGGESHRDATN